MNKLLSLFFIGFSLLTMAQDGTNNPFGKGLVNVMAKDSSWSTKMSFRFQSRYDGSYDLGADSFSDEAYVRRARIKGSGFAFSPKIKYKFEYDVANGYVLDAVLKYNFAGNFTLWFGQTKLPGNIERVFSSQKLQLVDRSLLNSKFTLDRDAGFQLRHHFKLGKTFLVREIFAVCQGEGLNARNKDFEVTSNGHGYTGRIELLPFGEFTKKGDYFASDLKREESPKLMVSATYDYNQNAMLTRGQKGSQIASGNFRDLQTIFVDAHFKYAGFSCFGEYVNRQTTNGSAVVDQAAGEVYYTGASLNLQMGYLMKNNWEIAGRYTQVTPEEQTGNNNINQYTLGFSRYVVGHNLKIQGDIGFTQEVNKNDMLLIRLQTEFNF
ncbi:MAG: porin [Crocinitomicaceae bacterium]